jgi:hypothetical protein
VASCGLRRQFYETEPQLEATSRNYTTNCYSTVGPHYGPLNQRERSCRTRRELEEAQAKDRRYEAWPRRRAQDRRDYMII